MPTIVTLAELKTYLTVAGDAPPAGDDPVLTALIDNVEAVFAGECGRDVSSFIDADSQVEVKDGTGTARLFLDHPIDTLTSVKLGYNSSAPDETLSPTNKTVLVWGQGSRVITRVDGGKFGKAGWPRYVEVAYDNLADIPENAKLAIMEVVASIYANRGSEGMKSETLGSFYTYARDETLTIAGTSSTWQAAVAANIRLVVA